MRTLLRTTAKIFYTLTLVIKKICESLHQAKINNMNEALNISDVERILSL